MGRSVIGLCAMAGMTVGGFVPAAWGASQLGLSSLLFSVVGAVVGVWFGSRLADY
jgi:uncharacterized membrane protein YeaQ/YmgE (transglycosylase-associated protein family)